MIRRISLLPPFPPPLANDRPTLIHLTSLHPPLEKSGPRNPRNRRRRSFSASRIEQPERTRPKARLDSSPLRGSLRLAKPVGSGRPSVLVCLKEAHVISAREQCWCASWIQRDRTTVQLRVDSESSTFTFSFTLRTISYHVLPPFGLSRRKMNEELGLVTSGSPTSFVASTSNTTQPLPPLPAPSIKKPSKPLQLNSPEPLQVPLHLFPPKQHHFPPLLLPKLELKQQQPIVLAPPPPLTFTSPSTGRPSVGNGNFWIFYSTTPGVIRVEDLSNALWGGAKREGLMMLARLEETTSYGKFCFRYSHLTLRSERY